MSINEWWSVDGYIGIDSWIVGLSTSVSPWGCTNDLVVVFDWATRVTLACVFAATTNTSTEHSLQDGAIVWATGVAAGVGDNVDINAVKFAWIWWSWVLKRSQITGRSRESLTLVLPQPQTLTLAPFGIHSPFWFLGMAILAILRADKLNDELSLRTQISLA